MASDRRDRASITPVPVAGDVAESTRIAPAAWSPVRETRDPAPAAAFPIGAALLALWAAGSAIALARFAIRASRFRRVVAAGRPAPPALVARLAEVAARLGVEPIEARTSDRVASPCVFALGRPVLLWPAGDAEFERGILAHELAHLRRKDHLVAWLEIAATIVFFWHPLVHLACREIRRHAEFACDAWAVEIAPGKEGRGAYAAALLRVAANLPENRRSRRSKSVAPALGAFDARFKDLERRLHMILRESTASRVTPLLGAAVIVATVLCLPSWIQGAPGDDDARPRVRVAEYDPDFDRPVRQLVLEESGGGRIVTGAVDERIRAIPGFRARNAGLEFEEARWDDGEDDADPCCEKDGEDALSFDIEVDADEPEPTESGIALLRRGEHALAVRAFAREVERGNTQNGLYNIACCYSLMGETDKAFEFLRRAVDAGYSNVDWMMSDDDLAALRGDERLEAIAGAVRDREAEHESGITLLRRGDYERAVRAFSRDVENGARQNGLYNIACCYSLMGDTDRAFDYLRQAVDAGYSNFEWMKRDDDLAALRGDERLEEIAGSIRDHEAEHESGITLLRRGEYERAVRAFSRDVENGGRQNGLYNIACCYSLMGDTDRALDYLRQAVDAGYSNMDWMQTDDDLSALRGDERLASLARVVRDRDVLQGFGAASWDELGKQSEERLRKNPRSGDAWLKLGWARLRNDDFTGAREAFEKQIECGTAKAIGHYNLACAASLMGETDEAFRSLDVAFEGGFDRLHHARNDADLAPLHDDPRWDAFIGKMRQRYGDCECDQPAKPAPAPKKKEGKRREVI